VAAAHSPRSGLSSVFFLSGRWSRAWRLDGDAAGRAELAGLDLMISVDLWLMRCVVFDRGLRSL